MIAGLSSLRRLAANREANIRADAAHYLGLVAQRDAITVLENLRNDEHPDVREIAAESLERLKRLS